MLERSPCLPRGQWGGTHRLRQFRSPSTIAGSPNQSCRRTPVVGSAMGSHPNGDGLRCVLHQRDDATLSSRPACHLFGAVATIQTAIEALPLGRICLGKGVKEHRHSIVEPCADCSAKSAQAPRPRTGRPLSRQFGGDPTEWQMATEARLEPRHARVAPDETAIRLHPPLPSVGASIVMERERQSKMKVPSTATHEITLPAPESDRAAASLVSMQLQ